MSSSLSEIVTALKRGEMIVLLDDATPRQHLYLAAAASLTTEETITRMVNIGRGVICAAIAESRMRELGLPAMGPKNRHTGVDFTVSVEARKGVSTGISSADRAKTLQILATTTEPKLELVTPGHVFPIRAKSGGVLVRSDVAEAAVDLMQLAELPPVATIGHVLDEKGQFPTGEELATIVRALALPSIAVTDIIRERLSTESIIERIATAKLPTGYAGEFEAHCFISHIDGAEHLALVKGDLTKCDEQGLQVPVLVRVQAEDRFSDLLGMQSTLGLQRIRTALSLIASEGRGVFVYVRHPRKGILAEQAGTLSGGKKERPVENRAGALREHGIGAQILFELGVRRIALLTNSARDLSALDAFNLELVDRVPFAPLSGENIAAA